MDHFSITAKDPGSEARAGKLVGSHGTVETPCFLPVATKGFVKALSSEDLKMCNVDALISNALHLYMRPGLAVIEKHGGLHKFLRWERTLFTDSGGFQLVRNFSYKITDKGVIFKTPDTGKKIEFTPELAIEIQKKLGSDVNMVLDHCPAWNAPEKKVEDAVRHTVEWAEIAKSVFSGNALLFGIVQGGFSIELREKCTRALAKLDLDGYGIGGLSIGEPKDWTHKILEKTVKFIDESKPRYLMGVGSEDEILLAVANGIDVFDSAFPTRNARHRTIFGMNGKYNVGNMETLQSLAPLEQGCECYTCKNYTCSQVTHYLRENDSLGMRLASIHNIAYMEKFMAQIREAIKEGKFMDVYGERLRKLKGH
ncbi:MAG: tRNA guanosine(34) transglycosylase Tgt [Thermoplasmata archaeon]|nr:tRNA guanosine(34) transglycosylase Tgt [Thermoplasmata archaeon]